MVVIVIFTVRAMISTCKRNSRCFGKIPSGTTGGLSLLKCEPRVTWHSAQCVSAGSSGNQPEQSLTPSLHQKPLQQILAIKDSAGSYQGWREKQIQTCKIVFLFGFCFTTFCILLWKVNATYQLQHWSVPTSNNKVDFTLNLKLWWTKCTSTLNTCIWYETSGSIIIFLFHTWRHSWDGQKSFATPLFCLLVQTTWVVIGACKSLLQLTEQQHQR